MNIKDLVGATLKEVFIYQYIDDYSNPDEPEDEFAMLSKMMGLKPRPLGRGVSKSLSSTT